MAPHPVAAQATSPLGVVRNLNLESERVGRVTAHFASPDRERARQLADLLNDAAATFNRDLGLSFPLDLAVLRPKEWFADIPGIPYAIPWPSMKERLIITPASLEEGLLVEMRSPEQGERLVNFVTLHEYGHVAAREYFRPGDQEDYIPVQWFRELVATYFAYAYVMSVDPVWAESAREEWKAAVDAFEPEVLSLDWSFMGAMDGRELARTYEWYQFLLNLRAAELFNSRGVTLIPALRGLTWGRARGWTTEALLDQLDDVVPELSTWARELGTGPEGGPMGGVQVHQMAVGPMAVFTASVQPALGAPQASPIEAALIHPPVAARFQCSEHALGAEDHVPDALGADCVVVRRTGGPDDNLNSLYSGDGIRNEDWHSWREPLLAPCDGRVVIVSINPETTQPGTFGPGRSSAILFRCGPDDDSDPIQVALIHVREVVVAEADRVEAGDVVARIGNNGSSFNPHVHIGAFRGELFSDNAVPLQIRFDLAAMGRLSGSGAGVSR
jgi:hypothetical protein